MKTPIIAISLLIVIAAVAFAHNVHGQGTGIIIERADATANISTTASFTLNSLIGNVKPRFVVEHANALKYYSLTPISSTLQSLFGQVADRFVIQYANSNQFYKFVYPVGLVSDTTPPQVSEIRDSSVGIGAIQIAWTTDEFASSLVTYGISSGVYTQTISDTLYYKAHAVTLGGLTLGNTYYYKIGSTDRSGNTYQSPEYNFTVKTFVYLPLVKKQ